MHPFNVSITHTSQTPPKRIKNKESYMGRSECYMGIFVQFMPFNCEFCIVDICIKCLTRSLARIAESEFSAEIKHPLLGLLEILLLHILVVNNYFLNTLENSWSWYTAVYGISALSFSFRQEVSVLTLRIYLANCGSVYYLCACCCVTSNTHTNHWNSTELYIVLNSKLSFSLIWTQALCYFNNTHFPYGPERSSEKLRALHHLVNLHCINIIASEKCKANIPEYLRGISCIFVHNPLRVG